MTSPDVTALLTGLDGLSHPARSRWLADRARAPGLEPLLVELYAGDRFQRQVAAKE